jgi:osmotically-inducible protein OsmY
MLVSTSNSVGYDIRSALDHDPRIPDSSEIAVLVEDHVVTLRGTVGSFRQRRAAVCDAQNVDKDYDVRDELEVPLLDKWHREDAEISATALRVLARDVEVPAEAIHVEVEDGWITLRGTVNYEFERDAACDDLTGLCGVCGITSEIKVRQA